MLDKKNKNILVNEILKLTKEYCDNFINNDIKIGQDIIQPSGKFLDHEEITNIVQSALDGWLTAGRFNKQFEKLLSEFIGVKFLMTVNSGSSANLIAFNTLCCPSLKDRAIKKNDEIITAAVGFPTTINPAIQFGAVPVFIDVCPKTYNIDANKVEKAITNKTKAIVIAHTLGNPFNLEHIKFLCEKYNLWLVEDCCDALGSKYKNSLVGTFGDIASLSFYPAHHITMGEGGAVFTNNPKLKRIAESIRDWGRDCYCEPGKDNTCKRRFDWQLGDLPKGYDHKYTYSRLGYNLKITDMQAACGLAQLNKLESFIEKRKKNFDYLKNLFIKNNLEKYFQLPQKTIDSDPSWFGFPLTIITKKILRYDLLKYYENKKIGTRLLFGGNLIKQPYLKNYKYKVDGDLLNTNNILENCFWLGIHPSLEKEHLQYITDSTLKFIEKI